MPRWRAWSWPTRPSAARHSARARLPVGHCGGQPQARLRHHAPSDLPCRRDLPCLRDPHCRRDPPCGLPCRRGLPYRGHCAWPEPCLGQDLNHAEVAQGRAQVQREPLRPPETSAPKSATVADRSPSARRRWRDRPRCPPCGRWHPPCGRWPEESSGADDAAARRARPEAPAGPRPRVPRWGPDAQLRAILMALHTAGWSAATPAAPGLSLAMGSRCPRIRFPASAACRRAGRSRHGGRQGPTTPVLAEHD